MTTTRSAALRPVRPPSGGTWALAVLPALVVAIASVVGLVRLAAWALQTRAGQAWDESGMDAVYGGSQALRRVLGLLGEISIGSAGVVLAVCVGLALLRHRYAAAIGAVVLVGGANVTTQLLKRVVLERADYGNLTIVSLPSGHTTVVVSLALAALLVVPRGLRLLTVLGGTTLAVVTGAGTVVAQWHRPADVLAALLVCLAWTGAVVTVLAVRRPLPPRRVGGIGDLVAALLGAAIAGAVLLAVGVRPAGGWSGFGEAALMLGVLGLATAATVALAARLAQPHGH